MAATKPAIGYTFLPLVKDSDYSKSIQAIDILSEGNLTIVDIEGNSRTYSFAAFDATGGEFTTFPYRLEVRARRIVSSTTTVPDADIIVLH
jgi:hypothetical protein